MMPNSHGRWWLVALRIAAPAVLVSLVVPTMQRDPQRIISEDVEFTEEPVATPPNPEPAPLCCKWNTDWYRGKRTKCWKCSDGPPSEPTWPGRQRGLWISYP